MDKIKGLMLFFFFFFLSKYILNRFLHHLTQQYKAIKVLLPGISEISWQSKTFAENLSFCKTLSKFLFHFDELETH